MHLHAWSAEQLQTQELPPDCALIRFADSTEQLERSGSDAPEVFEKLADKLDVICHDCDATAGLDAPDRRHAQDIVEFIAKNRHRNALIAQCQAGIGRSRAVIMAAGRMAGEDITEIERFGTHNQHLYRLLCEAAELPPPDEPLVALAVRVKYPTDRTHAFLLSLKRQRHRNWKVLFHSDGPNEEMVKFCTDERQLDARIYHMQTATKQGHWGHKWRAMALTGMKPFMAKYVGISNDDNYYTPGYLEQMVFALEHEQADLALCSCLHRYAAWGVVEPGNDLGCWLASAALIRDVPWSGSDFKADMRHIEALKKAAKKVAYVNKPLFVKN